MSFSYLDHFWSLAVEEHFYFFWPLIVWLCSRRRLMTVSLGIAAASLASRAAMASHMNEVALYVLTPFRLDALCVGGCLAALGRGPFGLETLRRVAGPAFAAAIALYVGSYALTVATGLMQPQFHQIRDGFIMVALSAVLISPLVAPAGSIPVRFFGSASLRFLGKYSYGLYVFHHFVSDYLVSRRTVAPLGRAVGSHSLAVLLQASAGFAASMTLAIASYHLFEKHFIALKRFWPAAGEPPAPAEPARAGSIRDAAT